MSTNRSGKTTHTSLSSPVTQGHGAVPPRGPMAEGRGFMDTFHWLTGHGHMKMMMASTLGALASSSFLPSVSNYELLVLWGIQFASFLLSDFLWMRLA